LTEHDLTHDILIRIQEGQTLIRNEVADLKRETHEGFADLHIQLTAIGQQLAGLTTAVYSGKSEIEAIKRRLERVERRLELHDESTP
jgi:hypothetical protein